LHQAVHRDAEISWHGPNRPIEISVDVPSTVTTDVVRLLGGIEIEVGRVDS